MKKQENVTFDQEKNESIDRNTDITEMMEFR